MDTQVLHVFSSVDITAQLEAVTRVLVAALLGTALGLERSIAGKHAGMRTYALVAAGSALFVVVGTLADDIYRSFPGLNPVAIAASVVLGIGFIGAGLSYVRSDHAELTTASGIWLAAGVGMATGFGLYTLSIASTITGLLIFSLLLHVENALRRKYERHND